MTHHHRCRCRLPVALPISSNHGWCTKSWLCFRNASNTHTHIHTHRLFGRTGTLAAAAPLVLFGRTCEAFIFSPVLFSSQFTRQKKYLGCLVWRCTLCLTVCHWKMPCYVYEALFFLRGPFMWFYWGISNDPPCPDFGWKQVSLRALSVTLS